MSYQKTDGTYVHTEPLSTAVVASAARTTTPDTGTSQEAGGRSVLRGCTLSATAKTGTSPTLDVTVQGSEDGTNWYTLGTYTQLTSSTTLPYTETKAFPTAKHVRFRWTIGGSNTPGWTFSVGSGAELV